MPDILIVDDDRELCELLCDYLHREGFSVRAAHDGTDGLHTATRARPDLIVCDIMMPGIDGLQLLRELRKQSSVPVLMLSAKRAESERIEGLELGADDYLPKPFQPTRAGRPHPRDSPTLSGVPRRAGHRRRGDHSGR